MLVHLKHAKNLLSSFSSLSVQQKELNWLLKVAWNLALKCEDHYKEMAGLFTMCHDLCSQLPTQIPVLKIQMSCQVMAAAALLHVQEKSPANQKRLDLLLVRTSAL